MTDTVIVNPQGQPLDASKMEVVTPQGAPVNPSIPPVDTPEYVAHMVALGEGKDPAEAVAALKAKTDTETTGETTDAPRLTDEVKDPAKTDEVKDPAKTDETKEPTDENTETKETTKVDFKTEFEDGTFVKEFNAEKLSPEFTKKLGDALGLEADQVAQMAAQFRAGQQALARETTGALHKAAGGKEAFDALVAWGQKNMTQEQKVFYDQQLNGPNAAEAIAVLRQKMNAGADPKIINVNGAGSGATAAFRDQSEMIVAMQDPRYQTSEQYRREVAQRVALMR